LNSDETNDNKKIPGYLERAKWMKDVFPNKSILEQHLRLLSVIQVLNNSWMMNL